MSGGTHVEELSKQDIVEGELKQGTLEEEESTVGGAGGLEGS